MLLSGNAVAAGWHAGKDHQIILDDAAAERRCML